jgi:putative ABC transport system permease protein
MRVSGPFSITILLRERGRYVPAVFAVCFSSLLLTMQLGMLLGFLGTTTRPIDRVDADLWVASDEPLAIGYSHPIPESWASRLASHPGVERVAPYVYGFTLWHKQDGGLEQCFLIGSRLDEGEVGSVRDMSPQLRGQLTRPGAVTIYSPDKVRLGLQEGVSEVAEVGGQRVQLAGVMYEGGRQIGMTPGFYCSLRTARRLLPNLGPDQTMYLIARCRNPADRGTIARELRERYPDMAVMTREEFADLTRNYWLVKTNAGVILMFIAALGLVVGAVITGQTLYAATVAAKREFAMLRALGVPHRPMAGMVIAQSFWVAVVGVGLAYPICLGLSEAALSQGIEAKLPPWLLFATGVFVVGIAVTAGSAALRSLRGAEPELLLR